MINHSKRTFGDMSGVVGVVGWGWVGSIGCIGGLFFGVGTVSGINASCC